MYQGSNFIIKASIVAICKNIRLAWQIVKPDFISIIYLRVYTWTPGTLCCVRCHLLLLVKESIQASNNRKL